MAPPLKLFNGAMVGGNNVNACAENVGNKNVAKPYGSFGGGAVDNLHAFKNLILGECT